MSTLAIDVRPARTGDGGAIAEVHDEAWLYAYRGIIPGSQLERMVSRRGAKWWESAIGKGSRILVLVAGGEEIVGYASYGRNRSSALPVAGEIYELYVRPAFHGLGFGKQLFVACRREIAANGVVGMAVWALSDNDIACDFYRAMGGTTVARGTENFGGVTLEKIAFTWV
ncbi:GNAT family N-acetyltransferase [Flaviflagellibacter deserti]|uniref:GNAT family N-acetyltransferase n=1 Tax=Flaviflagellibacter deserti TaxID=2267266 RepID=A0ABV9Z4U6_9HYPH